MKNLKDELVKIAQSWNASGEYDDTEFAGRFFVGDTELDEFAMKHGLCSDSDCYDQGKVELACECKLDCDYDGNHDNRNFGENEVIFNHMKNKPGPKPKPESQKARGKSLSFPAPMADFLDSLETPGLFMRELLAKSPEYKKYLRNLKTLAS